MPPRRCASRTAASPRPTPTSAARSRRSARMPRTPSSPLLASRSDGARGQVLVLFALLLVVLLLISALAVDYGGWLVTRRSYQNMADAAALAGAQQLTRPLSSNCTSGVSKNRCAREAAWKE